MAWAEGKYVLLTTYRRDGRAVSTPVWVVGLDQGRVGFTTSSGSGKYKRLRHTDRVTVQPCDVRGRVKPGTTAQNATAVVVSGTEYLAIKSKVRAKYGVMWYVTQFLGAVGGVVKRHRIPYGDVGVVITPTS
ncbi:MAG: putative F420-dependent enzyme [Acidimicrobiaceae bacterium]|nr:putative F420-dependent enzyme [Acidimicrobiaceae bacterium]